MEDVTVDVDETSACDAEFSWGRNTVVSNHRRKPEHPVFQNLQAVILVSYIEA